jgi:hypothetical protein
MTSPCCIYACVCYVYPPPPQVTFECQDQSLWNLVSPESAHNKYDSCNNIFSLPLISTGLSLFNLFSDEYSVETRATNIQLNSLLIRLLGYDVHCELKLETLGVCILNLFLFLIRRVAKRIYILLSVSVDLSV